MRARAFKCILLLAILVHYATLAFSQAPQGFSYQAVIRSTTGQVLSNQDILVRISISDEAKTVTYYTEVDTVTTSAYGSINLIIGKGHSTDNFSAIPWSNGNMWVNVEVDRTRTSGYTALGSTRLYSVPYALYSLSGSPGPEGPKGDTGNGISSVAANGNGTYTFYFTNGSTYITDNLTGPQGPQGIQGETGPQGIPGLKGDQGLPGTGLNNKGNWVSGTTYSPGDYVFAENTAQTANSMWIVKAAAAFSSTTQPRLDLANWVEFEAPAGPQGPAGPLVTGTAGQTLRHDGTSWVANSLLYNNGTNIGIGTTSPQSKLHVNGSIQLPDDITTAGGLKIGSFGSYLARQSSDGSTILNTGQANILFKNLGTETFRINSSGNVGIGNASPSARLHVTPGQVRLDGSTNPYIGVNNGTYQGYLEITSNVLGLTYNNYVRLAILSNGNVGIGTTNPYALLTVKTATDRNVGIRQNSTKTELFSANDANTAYSILEINASTLTLNHQSGGNVGIGTTTPSQKLHVAGGNGIINNVFIGDVGHGANWAAFTNSSSANTSGYALLHSADGMYTLINKKSGTGYIGFRIDNIDKMVISNSGYLGIGTTTPGVKLDVVGDIRTSTKFAAGNYGLNAGNLNAYSMELGGPTPTATSGQATLFFHHHGVVAHQLRYNTGTLYLEAAGNGYGTTSTPSFLVGGSLYAAINGGNVGVGITAPVAKMEVKGTSSDASIPLFQVKDNAGTAVFIVYKDSVRVVVNDLGKADSKGVFAVSGRSSTKANPTEYTRITADNDFIGLNAGRKIRVNRSLTSGNRGIYNVAIGTNALAVSTGGEDNIAIGTQSLYNSITSYNIAIGRQAMYSNGLGLGNTAVGWVALRTNTSGNNNTAIGYGADVSNGTWANTTTIGYNARATASNQVRIGNSSVSSIGGYAGWSNLSDIRFKREVKSNVPGLEFILKLKPITYYLDIDKLSSFLNIPNSLRSSEADKEKSNILQTGFSAQDVEEAANSIGFNFSGVDKPKNQNDYYSLRYSEFTVPLVKAVQELNAELERQKAENLELKKVLDEQKKLIDELRSINPLLLKRIETLESKESKTTNNQ